MAFTQNRKPLRRMRWPWLAVIGLTSLWSIVLARFAIARHLAFQTGFDLAVYSHIIWTTTQGRPFWNSLVEDTTNFLAHHFVPLLAVLAPLYALWPDARTLLALQSVILASAALPLFRFARQRIGDRLGLVVVAAFLLSPALHYIALADFHEIALAVPLLMAAGAALLSRRRWALVVWLALALLVKEEVTLIALSLALYMLLIHRDVRFGLALTAGVAAWGIVLFGLLPALGMGGGLGFIWRYRSLGDTPTQALLTLISRPDVVWGVVVTRAKALFVLQLLAPLAMLPFIGLPATLLALPPLAYLLLSDYLPQTSIRHHYTATVLPFLMLATVIALQKLRGRSPRWAGRAGGLLLVSAFLAAALWSPLPGSRSYEPQAFAVTEEAKAAQALVAAIPARAAVAADLFYQPWLANRWWIADLGTVPFVQFTAPPTPEYVVGRVPGPYAIDPPVYPWIIADTGGESISVVRYHLVQATPGGVGVWRARPPDEAVALRRYSAPFYGGLTLVAAGTPPEAPGWGAVVQVKAGDLLPVWMAWGASRPLGRRITFSLHLRGDDDHTRAQVDSEMHGGRFPTTLWHTWMDSPVVVGEFPLSIPLDLPAGRYRLLAGAFETDTVSALTMPDGQPWLELTMLEVIAR